MLTLGVALRTTHTMKLEVTDLVGCSIRLAVKANSVPVGNMQINIELTVNTEKIEEVEKFLDNCILWETPEGNDSEGHWEAELQGGQCTEPSDEKSWIS